mmetsp:Transcript_20065/g.46740  ORF Transcript_20065/g.46740 Transcript_20065/m.46740 type:complete len:220 (+) Transcript_20065:317-976(+)
MNLTAAPLWSDATGFLMYRRARLISSIVAGFRRRSGHLAEKQGDLFSVVQHLGHMERAVRRHQQAGEQPKTAIVIFYHHEYAERWHEHGYTPVAHHQSLGGRRYVGLITGLVVIDELAKVEVAGYVVDNRYGKQGFSFALQLVLVETTPNPRDYRQTCQAKCGEHADLVIQRPTTHGEDPVQLNPHALWDRLVPHSGFQPVPEVPAAYNGIVGHPKHHK